MSMRDRLRPHIARAVRRIEGGPARRRFLGAAMARYYRARGANPVVVREALDHADHFNLSVTRSTLRWALAIEGRGSLPVKYRPDRRVLSPEGREVALARVQARYAETHDPELGRHLSYLKGSDCAPDDETRRFVATTLTGMLTARAGGSDPAATMSVDAGFEVLCKLHDALSEAGLRPFLVSGTLLGQVRSGDLLAHDYDLDLGIAPGEATPAEVAAALERVDGLSFEVEDARVWGTDASGVAFDVFVHYERNGRWYHRTRTHAWANTPFGLVPAPFRDREFWIPDDVDTYLTENYGTWRDPVAFYHKSFDTPNREYLDTTESLMYLYEVAVGAIETGDRFACESAIRELSAHFGIDLTHLFARSCLLEGRSLGGP